MLTRPNSFVPPIDIVQDKLYTIVMDVPGMTNEDIRLSRQNVTTIVKGVRPVPYAELMVKVERSERTYGDFTQTFKVPQEYERRWASVTVVDGVLKIVFKPDTDEEGLAIEGCGAVGAHDGHLGALEVVEAEGEAEARARWYAVEVRRAMHQLPVERKAHRRRPRTRPSQEDDAHAVAFVEGAREAVQQHQLLRLLLLLLLARVAAPYRRR